MPTAADTFARLVHFFNQNPELVPMILQEPNHVEVWERIFIYFFNKSPQDDRTKQVPSYWRKGSSDPLWDELLFKEKLGCMQAMNSLIEGWRNSTIPIPSHKEAA